MLKGNRGVSACSLISCRIRAEALARAFNTRLWPCAWVTKRSSVDRGDGIDDEEEFFDASPSPVEVEDESLFCQQHSSAATEAGRAKLYELLQQHASDDAIDVFYDVSEDAGLTDTCLTDGMKEPVQVDNFCQSSEYRKLSTESNILKDNLDDSIHIEKNSDIELSKVNGTLPSLFNIDQKQDISKTDPVPSISCCSSSGSWQEHELNNDLEPDDTFDKNLSNENEVSLLGSADLRENGEENSIMAKHLENIGDSIEDEIPRNEEINEITTENLDIEPLVFSNEPENLSEEENTVNSETPVLQTVPEPKIDDENQEFKEHNPVSIAVTLPNSPSPTSESSLIKSPSLLSDRLHVFEESRPKISRTTSLKTGKTPPGTPSRKKIVRFADVLGLDLEDVRHILSGDVPIIPSSAYTDLDLKAIDLPSSEPVSQTIEVKSRQPASWNTLHGATATNVLYPIFSIPGEQPDFLDRVRFQGICLETVVVSDMSVQCTCRVMNYGFHKKVTVRYSVNDWQSSNDIDGLYVQGSSNGETDNFAFSIFLSPMNRNMKFALKYVVNGREYWDNNKGQNYCFSYHGNDNMQHLSSSLWQHQFW